MSTAVIYARYSSHNQTEQSIEGQLHDAYDFAKKNGYNVIGEYIDRAKSATSDDRPEFQRMIKESASKVFQYVIVWKQDRFARNRYDSAIYKRILKNNGVRVVSVMENITDSPEGVILEGLLEAMAEYYYANLAENIRRGKAETVRKGFFPGGSVPFGYVLKERKLTPDPRTAPIVHEVFSRYAKGERMKDIADDLNNRGIRNSLGCEFKHTTIICILRNRTYIGEYTFNGEVIPGFAPPLIERELFDRSETRLAFNRRNPAAFRVEDYKSLLLDKFFCGECGHKMYGSGAHNSKGNIYYYYQCSGRYRFRNGCRLAGIQKTEIEYAVCKVVSDFMLNKKRRTLESLADSIMAVYLSEIDTSELKNLEKQRAQIEIDLNRLVDSLITMPDSARPRIGQRIDALEQQRIDLDIRLARKKAESDVYFSKDDFVKALQITFDDLKSRDNQQFIIEKFVNSVYMYRDGRIVVYLNHIPGLPSGPDDDMPGKDDWTSGRTFPLPPEHLALKEFAHGFSLFRYTQADSNKQKQSPLFFFLHGRIGIMFLHKGRRGIAIRDHGRIIGWQDFDD